MIRRDDRGVRQKNVLDRRQTAMRTAVVIVLPVRVLPAATRNTAVGQVEA